MRKFLHAYVATVVAFWSLLLMPMMPAVAANSCEWDGSSSNLWSDSANWNNCGGGVPQNGDIVTLPTVASNKTMSNDIVGTLTLDQFYIADGYTLTGNAITVSGSMVFQSTGSTVNVSAFNFANAATGVSLQIDGTGNSIATSVGITLPAGDFNAYVNADFTAPAFTGTMTNFNKWGTSTLTSASGSTFTTVGGVNVSDGIWGCSSADCAGDSGNFIAQHSGAKLLFTGDASLPNDIGLNYLSGATAVGMELNDTVGVSLLGTLSANGSAQIQLGNGSNFQTIGNVNLISSLEVIGNSAATSQYLVSSSGLSNSGELSCSNVKCWLDTNSPTYNGVIRGKSGSVIQSSLSDSLGSTVGNTVIESGATLYSTSNISVSEPITVSGAGEGTSNYLGAIAADTNDRTYTGTITLAGDTTIYSSGGSNLIIAGTIDGNGNLNFESSGPTSFVTLDGSTANTYTGTTYVEDGELQLIKDPGVVAIPGNLVIDGTAGLSQVQINSAEQIADTANINMIESVAFNAQLQTDAETIGSLSGTGSVYIVQNTFNVGADNTSTTYSGSITTNNIVPGIVNKQGTGTFTLNGTTSAGFEPNFTVSGGKLLVNNDYTGAEFGINGGTLGGSGTVGTTTGTTGVFSPGNSPGCVTVSGDLVLNSPTVFDQEIAGGTACSQYDQTTLTGINGQIILNNPTLNVMLSYTPAPGTQFTILRSLNNTITGQFNGLPDGTIFTANGVQFRINYIDLGGESSQIVLTTIGGTLAQTGSNTSLITFAAIGLVFLALGGLAVERITRRRKYAHVK